MEAVAEKPRRPDEEMIVLLIGAVALDLGVSLGAASSGALGNSYSLVSSTAFLMLGFFLPALLSTMLLIVIWQALVGAARSLSPIAIEGPALPGQKRYLDLRQRFLDERATALDRRQVELLRREKGVVEQAQPTGPEALSANGLILYPGHYDRGSAGAGTAVSQKLDYRIRRNSRAS